ncbi:MAG: universal stress protein [Acidobacteriota bacterium]|nr:MAG: universal stress protein [Acidobacteriota bacterium]
MVPPKTIVAAIDFSEYSLMALETAFHLLPDDEESTLILLHVLEIPKSIDPIGLLKPSLEELSAEALERMEDLIPLNRSGKIAIQRLAIQGAPAKTIAKAADENGADMILVGTHGRKGLARVLLGSTAEALLREAPCQVLVVKHHP